MTSTYAGQLALHQSVHRNPAEHGMKATNLVNMSSLRSNDIAKLKSGIDVMKIAQTGKKLRRKVFLSSDEIVLTISSRKKDEFHSIFINRIYSITLGQVSEKFASTSAVKVSSKKKSVEPISQDYDERDDDDSIFEAHYQDGEERLSLSILYNPEGDHLNKSLNSLDLILLTKSDYDTLYRTVTDVIHRCQTSSKNDVLNLDRLLLCDVLSSMGKEGGRARKASVKKNVGTKGGKNDRIKISEWIPLIESKLGVSVLSHSEHSRVYKDFAKSNGMKPDDGVPLEDCVKLLQKVRLKITEKSSETSLSPVRALWDDLTKGSSDSESVDASTFLNFLKTVQNEEKVTLKQVRELFAKLNEQNRSENGSSGSSGDEKISRDAFEAYMASDANDAFDPVKGWMGRGDMGQPLSNYWINSCNDPCRNTRRPEGVLLALFRGCRCLEFKVWDGAGKMKDEPVVSCSPDVKSLSGGTEVLPFLDIAKTIKSFLRSNPDVFPIILSLENHCALAAQNKLARYVNEVFGRNLFKPTTLDGRLPSPESLKGMVVIKSKHPISKEDAVALFDDYDADIKYLSRGEDPLCSFDQENTLEGVESFISDAPPDEIEKTPDELWDEAKENADDAKEDARKAEERAFRFAVEANKAEELASKLLTRFGWTFDHQLPAQENEQGKKTEGMSDVGDDDNDGASSMPGRGETSVGSGDETMSQGSTAVTNGSSSFDFAALSVDGKKSTPKKAKRSATIPEKGIPETNENTDDLETSDEIAATLESMKKKVAAAEASASKASEAASVALAALQLASNGVTEAQEEFEAAKEEEKHVLENARISASNARSKREHSDTAAKRITTVGELLSKCKDQSRSAEAVANTAVTESSISDQRLSDAVARAEKAQKNASDAVSRADKETKEEEKMERDLNTLRQKSAAATKKFDLAGKKKADATSSLVKITEAIEIFAEDGTPTIPQSVKDSKNEAITKLNAATAEYDAAEKLLEKTKSALDDLDTKLKKQSDKAMAARNHADQFTAIAEQLAEHAEEEKEAANLRRVATEKAEVSVRRIGTEVKSLEAQLAEAERAAKEADEIAQGARKDADKLENELVPEAKKNKQDKIAALREKMAAKDEAQRAFDTAQKVKERREKKRDNLRSILRDATEVYDRAQRQKTEKKHRKNATSHAQRSAIAARDRAVSLRKKSDEAKREAELAIARAAEATAVERYAYEYKVKMQRIKPVSLKLTKMTLLNGVKLKYLEKSKTMPYSHMHNVSEEQLISTVQQTGRLLSWNNWVEFNSDHMSRVFPTMTGKLRKENLNPLLPWAMGCQLVAIFFQQGEELVLNDGRFRENGSSGYVLKPNLHRESSDYLGSFQVQIVGGERIPKLVEPGAKSKSRHPVNVRVKVSFFDVVPGENQIASSHHWTGIVKGNCLNPVWNEKEEEGAKFKVASPGVAMLIFSVWEVAAEKKKSKSLPDDQETLVAVASVPYNCLREGYRSVQLFDRNHTRCGTYALSSLFVHVKVD